MRPDRIEPRVSPYVILVTWSPIMMTVISTLKCSHKIDISFSPPQFASPLIHSQYSNRGLPSSKSVYLGGLFVILSLRMQSAMFFRRLRATDSPCRMADKASATTANMRRRTTAPNTRSKSALEFWKGYLDAIAAQVCDGSKQTIVVLWYRDSDRFKVPPFPGIREAIRRPLLFRAWHRHRRACWAFQRVHMLLCFLETMQQFETIAERESEFFETPWTEICGHVAVYVLLEQCLGVDVCLFPKVAGQSPHKVRDFSRRPLFPRYARRCCARPLLAPLLHLAHLPSLPPAIPSSHELMNTQYLLQSCSRVWLEVCLFEKTVLQYLTADICTN